MTITRTVHGHTVTLRGNTFAADIITRPPEHKRAGVQVILDDDALGHGVTTRLHVYGVAGWRELRALVDAIEKEIEGMSDRKEFFKKRFETALETSYSEPRDRKFRRAFTLGWDAAQRKDSRDNCPYHDHRTETNKVTFARAYIRQWRNGYDFFGFIERHYLKLAFKKTGWMAPDGTYYAVSYRMDDWAARLHLGLAVELTDEFYPGQASDSDFDFVNGPQAFLLRHGWIRVDHHEADFMIRPTKAQYETLQMWLNWRIDNPAQTTILDYKFYAQLQDLCNWLRGDATGDYSDLEDKLLENREQSTQRDQP